MINTCRSNIPKLLSRKSWKLSVILFILLLSSTAIVIDATTGAIIKSKNEHEALPVASISKIVTALGAINTIEPTRQIVASNEAQNVQPSKIGMMAGQTWTRDDLLNSLLLISANDAAYALAEASAGSIEQFQKTQNSIAKNLGMQDSNFGDPSGLDTH